MTTIGRRILRVSLKYITKFVNNRTNIFSDLELARNSDRGGIKEKGENNIR